MSLGQHFPGETIVQVVPNIEHLVKIVSQDMPMDLVTFFLFGSEEQAHICQ